MIACVHRPTGGYRSAENIEALTGSHPQLTSQSLESLSVVDVREHSLPVKQQLEHMRHCALLGGDQANHVDLDG